MLIQKFCFYLIEDLLCQQYFDQNFFNYHFDFDENYSGLLKEFRHLSLFSICLHFLRCIKSCDMWNIPYCKLCSRVSDYTFAPCNSYDNLLITFGSSVLDLTADHRIDLDVFLSNADVNLRSYTKDNGKCCFFQLFEYAEDVFCAFSSILLRVYLNITYVTKKLLKLLLSMVIFYFRNFGMKLTLTIFMNSLICLTQLI